MTRLAKQYYYTASGDKRLNCYKLTIPKEIVEKLTFQNEKLTIKIENCKIVVDKLKK